MSNLLTQCGSQRCSLEQLLTVPEPQKAKTYTPLNHYDFAVNVRKIASDLLKDYKFAGEQYALSSGGAKMFGVISYCKKSSNPEDLNIAIELEDHMTNLCLLAYV